MRAVDHSQNVVEVKNVSFSYGGGEVLKNINLNIHRGDYLVIVGANGSGKTTLLKIMLGLLAPRNGTVKLFGQDIGNFRDREKIGYVPQKATNFDTNFPATVHEVVLMGRFARKGLIHRITEEDHHTSRRALELVEMSAFHERLIGELSGGQQQRVFIARALATDPEILFLDEPTAGVDKAIKNEFYGLLKKFNEQLRLTVVLITHDTEDIRHGSMHVACIDRELFFHDSLDEYLKEAGSKKSADTEPIITHRHRNV